MKWTTKRWMFSAAVVCAAGAAFLYGPVEAGEAEPVKYKRQVKYPTGYRDWTHVKSMVIEKGHPLYDAFGGIHHIYANDKALKALKGNKPYPNGAVFVFDLLEAKSADNAVTEGPRKVVGVMERDSRAFSSTGGWGFEGFKGDSQDRAVTEPMTCFGCHQTQAAKTGFVFTTYRP